jgi:hypothetical protein
MTGTRQRASKHLLIDTLHQSRAERPMNADRAIKCIPGYAIKLLQFATPLRLCASA